MNDEKQSEGSESALSGVGKASEASDGVLSGVGKASEASASVLLNDWKQSEGSESALSGDRKQSEASESVLSGDGKQSETSESVLSGDGKQSETTESILLSAVIKSGVSGCALSVAGREFAGLFARLSLAVRLSAAVSGVLPPADKKSTHGVGMVSVRGYAEIKFSVRVLDKERDDDERCTIHKWGGAN